MTHLDPSSARVRLDAALDGLAATFGGMTARPEENNCECHWGSAEELALLKVPDVRLDPDLLRRTWRAPDWHDHGAVLRRILPQLAPVLVEGSDEDWLFGGEEVGQSLARGHWQEWPAVQADAVNEFLHAWWAHTLTQSDPAVPVHEVIVAVSEASRTARPWLAAWETLTGRVADRHLADAADRWEYELLRDHLPWNAWEDSDRLRAELTAWLLRHAPDRLRASGASEDLLHRLRLIGLVGPERYEDPHWPGHRY